MTKVYRTIAVWGWGREGQAGYTYLKSLYPDADFTIIEKSGVDAPERVISEADLVHERFDLVFKSPGVSLYRPELDALRAKGADITSGTNLWFEAHPDACVVAVTGTKGKSTTSALIHHMLQKCGIHSVLAGNIGKPLLDVEPQDVCVVELSSFQIADLKHHPEIAVLTNLYEAHLEWHGTAQQYHADKMRLFELSDETTAIIGADDETAKGYLGDRDNVLFYGRNTGDLAVPEFLNKPHNLRNIAAAMTVVEALNALSRLPVNALDDFQPLPHRQEIVGERDGITFINDSISTVPETTAVALEAFNDKPVSVIVGGEEKHQDYSVVADMVKKHGNVHVFCIPDSGSRIHGQIDGSVLCKNMEDAVRKSITALPGGGYVLMSPGTPSFPIYKNYTERGEHFRKLCGF